MLATFFNRLGASEDGGTIVPSMDGALRPNQRLQNAPVLLEMSEPDNLIAGGRWAAVSSGNELFKFVPGQPAVPLSRFEAPITAMALFDDRQIAVGLENGTVVFMDGDGGTAGDVLRFDGTAGGPTALSFTDQGALLVAFGSAVNPNREWRRDLLQKGSSGSVWRVERGAEPARLAGRLAWASGVVEVPSLGIVVSEAWSHRLFRIGQPGANVAVIDQLPGYPGRVVRVSGGYCLCLFAPRLPIVEFILREAAYRARMMAEVPEPYWVAPALRSGRDYREPLLGGAVKQLGITKPWAQTRSYGMVVLTDPGFVPVDSYHSRGDGTRHGVTSTAEFGGRLLFSSRGGDLVGALEGMGIAK